MSVSQRDPSMVAPSVDACANFIFSYLHFPSLRFKKPRFFRFLKNLKKPQKPNVGF